MFNYGDGNDSIIKKQQKEEQKIYGIEYGQRLLKYERLWVSVEAAYSTHEYTKVDDSYLIKLWGIYKFNISEVVDLYSGIGIGLSTYKDNELVKGDLISSLGFRIGLEYQLTENFAFITGYKLEHNSGIWYRDSGRNIDLIEVGVKYYF
jgi:opacity protein-like surface antigen